MEKLIIEFQQSLDTIQQTEEFVYRFYDLNEKNENAFEFGKKHVKEHCKKVTREFSEDTFKNMKTMEEVYEFIKELFLENNYVACDFLEIPKSFENLTPFKTNSSYDEMFKTLEDKMNMFSFWILTHVDCWHSETYKCYLRIKTYKITHVDFWHSETILDD